MNFKTNSRPLFAIIFKLKNDNFKTRDFSPLIERVLTGVSKVIVYRRFCDFLNELWTSVNEPLEAWSLNILLSRIRLKLKLKLIYRQILELFSSFSYFGIAFCNLSGGLNLGLNQQMYTYT